MKLTNGQQHSKLPSSVQADDKFTFIRILSPIEFCLQPKLCVVFAQYGGRLGLTTERTCSLIHTACGVSRIRLQRRPSVASTSKKSGCTYGREQSWWRRNRGIQKFSQTASSAFCNSWVSHAFQAKQTLHARLFQTVQVRFDGLSKRGSSR